MGSAVTCTDLLAFSSLKRRSTASLICAAVVSVAGAVTCGSAVCLLFLLLLLTMSQLSNAAMTRAATPPMTTPTMRPVCVFDRVARILAGVELEVESQPTIAVSKAVSCMLGDVVANIELGRKCLTRLS